ncbi:MAG: metallophosphoesterase [Candidatus Sericytochromatia bacterium]
MASKQTSLLTGAVLLALASLTPAVEGAVGQNRRSLDRLKRDTHTQAYSFVVTGDNRDGDGVLDRILSRARDYRPRFALHTGDFVPAGGQQDYLRFLGRVQRLPYPLLPALGNHDAVGQGRRWYQRYFGEPEFAFSYGPDRFIFVDNSNSAVSPKQLQRLRTELEKPARYRFVIMHMPPGNLIWFHAFTQGANEMVRLIESHKTQYVFMGHIHIYDEMVSNSTHYLISGGAGAPLYRMPLYFSPEGGAFHHFTLIQVSPKGIKTKVVKTG